MATVIETIRRIFPSGTNYGMAGADFSAVPLWPPDAFALAATLVEQTGCYADVRYGGYGGTSKFAEKTYQSRVAKDGIAWRELDQPEQDEATADAPHEQPAIVVRLQSLWKTLLNHGDAAVTYEERPGAATYEWWDAAIALLTIADEASTGMGFPPPLHRILPLVRQQTSNASRAKADAELKRLMHRRRWADLVFRHYDPESLKDPTKSILKNPLHSLCIMASIDEVSVQPKTMTTQTGMTLRSLTHHLALLPPRAEVSTRWILFPWSDAPPYGTSAAPGRVGESSHVDQILNLLLVPFPYQIHGMAFRAGGTSIDQSNVADRLWQPNRPNFFDLEQHWLKGVEASAMAAFLGDLIRNTGLDVRAVHGVIMPELALNKPLVDKLAPLLAQETKLEFFVCGTLDKSEKGRPRNSVYTNLYNERRQHHPGIYQSKHHRWQLEKYQIRRYHLGHALSTRTRWWEKIDVSNRHCNFFVFRPSACMATLVCEDLARVDPVQRVLRAIGPNLVVALLLDGPQKLGRWSHRYATGLAEDPGSAVLTLTAVGMVERSVDPGQPLPREIALWKDSRGAETLELALPNDAHALLLSIETNYEEHQTLDRRSDNCATAALSLAGVRAIAHPNPPDWARRR